MIKKILITGGAGFIGHHLAKKLCNEFDVTILDNLNNYYSLDLKNKRNQQLKENVKLVILDLCNFQELKDFFNDKNYDVVFHLAAQAGVRYSFDDPKSYIDNNIIASFNLLDILKEKKIKHLLFSSTSSVYGYSTAKRAFLEIDTAPHQLSLYASTKKSVESLVHNYSHNYKIPSTVLRFFTVYGPWGRPDMALFKFVKSALKNETIEVYNNGEMWRDFTYIDDLVNAISILMHKPPNKNLSISNDSLSPIAPYRIVNIGNQTTVKLTDFINVLEHTLNTKINIKYLPMQPGDVPFTLADSSLLYRLTGFKPSTKIETGIKFFFDWYKDYFINKIY